MTVSGVARAAVAGLFACLAAMWPGRAESSGLFELRWSEIAPGVWLGERPDPLRYPVVANTLVVIGGERVLVYDGGGFPSQADGVIAQVRRLTALPVAHVVVSQWHGDKSRAVAQLRAAWPQAEVLSSPFTRDAMLGAPLQNVTRGEREGGVMALVTQVAESLAEGRFIDGSPLAPEELPYWRRFVADGPVHAREFERIEIVAPTRTIAGSERIDLGGRIVELRVLAPANTKGDMILILPAERIVAASDIVVAPVPYGFNAYPRAWARALDEIAALEPVILVPGHGDVQRDLAFLRLLRETLVDVAGQVDRLLAGGSAPEELPKAVDWSKLEPRFTRGDPLKARFMDLFFKAPVVTSAYNEAKGIDPEKLTGDPGAGR